MDRHPGPVPGHRPVERLPEERRAVARHRGVLVGVGLPVLDGDEAETRRRRLVEQLLRVPEQDLGRLLERGLYRRKTASVAVKPCRNVRPPTGPISPAQKNPPTADVPSAAATAPAS